MIETSNIIIFAFIQLVVVLGLSPLFNTLIKKWKANFQGRRGPKLMQGYYDLLKLFRKEAVVSNQTSWLFLFTPLVIFASVCGASLLVPTLMTNASSQAVGGIILLTYLFALGRFFMVSAAMEPGGGFCGMAGSREMMLSCLIEPSMLLALFVVSMLAGTTDLFEVQKNLSVLGLGVYSPAYILALASLFIASIAEMCRIPFDNPETHYELTMIHEGMLLDYSGQPLGMMFWSAWTKQLLIISLIANLLFPWGLATGYGIQAILTALAIYIGKLLVVCLMVAITETVVVKMRLFRVKEALSVSFIIAVIALTFAAQQTFNGGLH